MAHGLVGFYGFYLVFLTLTCNTDIARGRTLVIGQSANIQPVLLANLTSSCDINISYFRSLETISSSYSAINSDMFNLSPVLLFVRSSRFVYVPRPRRSSAAVLTALLLLLGGIELNPGPGVSCAAIGSVNVRSVIHKSVLLHSLIAENNLDVIALCETWCSSNDPSAILQDVAPEGFLVRHVPRPTSQPGKRGGGLAVVYRDTVQCKPVTVNATITSFELQSVTVQFGRKTCLVLNLYRPPNSSPTQTFFDELAELLAEVVTLHPVAVLLCGDLNCPGPTPSTVHVNLQQTLADFSFIQHVTTPTRENNLLDIFASLACPVTSVNVIDSHELSDHRLVKALMNYDVRRTTYVNRQWRPLRQVDYASLDHTLMTGVLVTNTYTDVDEYVDDINRVVTSELDKVAPTRTSRKARRAQPCDSFLTQEARESVRVRRRLERLWNRTGDETVRQHYRAACRTTNRLINDSRSKFLTDRISAAVNCKQKWRELKRVLHPNSDKPSGLNENRKGFHTSLSNFFIDKVSKLHESNKAFLSDSHCSTNPFLYDSDCSMVNFAFSPVTSFEVLKLITGTKFKFSPVDDFPSCLIKSCSTSFSVIISNLANLSFTQGKFPSNYKRAQITPILKKPTLNSDDPANYRPISNLNSMSKLLERLALARISPAIISSTNFNPLQSAYRKLHSTETCILKTLTDIYTAVDSGSSALLVALDLSAAFDTVCHNTLLTRLENMYGMSGSILTWVSSYLSDRTQSVFVDGQCSPPTLVTSGVPQGSVLGPLFFTAYTSPVFSLISSFGLSQQHYADDSQVYTSVSKTGPYLSFHTVESCLSTLRCWYAQNSLSINPSKSEAMCVSTAQRLKQISASGITSVMVAGATVNLSNKIVSLGLTIDKSLTFSSHVQFVVRSSMYHVRAIKHIRHLISEKDAALLATCLVQSKLDYLNSALHDTSAANIRSLQRVQNAAARVALNSSRYTSISHLLSTLHWLPVAYRIKFKIASLTHSALNTKQPAYIYDLLHPYTPARTLRSSDQHLLQIPRTHLRLTDQSFATASPTIWNSLPFDLRTTTSPKAFRSKLKTFLFASAFTVS